MGDKFDMPTAKVGRARNAPLESGVYKYSRSQMYHKKAIYKFAKKKTPKAAAEKKPVFVEKKVGGAKNGGTRKVATNKPKFDYPTTVVNVVKTSKNLFSKQERSLRPSLGAGTIAIVLAGVHKGKKEGDIFESKKEEYKPSDQRKADQVTVDKGLIEAVKKHADGKLLKQYLRTG